MGGREHKLGPDPELKNALERRQTLNILNEQMDTNKGTRFGVVTL